MLARMPASTSASATSPTFVDVDGVRVVDHADWNATVERFTGGTADTYLRLGYHRASAFLEPNDAAHPTLLHITAGTGGEWLLPLLVRPLPNGAAGFDATSAYGYGGPLALGSPDLAAVGAALDAWARANDIAATFLRLHPLLDNARLVPPTAELIQLGATVAWDVTAGRELLPEMHTHHRRAVRKADRAELELRITAAPSDLADFRTLYETTMRRQEAEAFYFFNDSYWRALVDEPDVELVLVDGILDGEVVASLLCYAAGSALHYHLGASADAARAIGASNRCFLAAAEWAQSRAMTHFHLGGGYGGGTDSPLFVFKHRYDPTSDPREFRVAKLVHDPSRYRELAGTDSTAGFFPPWRA